MRGKPGTTSDKRQMISARLTPADFDYFAKVTDAAGLQAGTAARQLIELTIRYMRANKDDYIDALAVLQRALKATKP